MNIHQNVHNAHPKKTSLHFTTCFNNNSLTLIPAAIKATILIILKRKMHATDTQ